MAAGRRLGHEMRDAEPRSEAGAEVAASTHLDQTGAERLGERETSQVDADHGLELGVNDEAHVETRIREAELDVGLIEDEPKGLLLIEPRGTLALTPKLEADEDLLVRQRVGTDAASQEPHQQAGVEIFGAQLLRGPLGPPRPERENDVPQLLAGLRRVVVVAAPADTL